MTINDSRLLKGTLKFGSTGAGQAICEGQITNLIVEQQDGDTDDDVTVLSGETAGGDASPGAWHATGTVIQDFDATPSLQQWSYLNRGTEQEFEFLPNDKAKAPTIKGTVYVKFLGLGGDVKARITRDFDWGIKGEPDFGTWGTAAVTTTTTQPKAITGVTSGDPATLQPSGATAPADLAALKANTVIGDAGSAKPTTAWTGTDHLVLGDSSKAKWSGTAWVVAT